MRRYPIPPNAGYFEVQKLLERGSEDDWFELCRQAAQEPQTLQALRSVVEVQDRDLRTRWLPLLKWIDWRAHRIELQIATITHVALRSPCEERLRLVEAMVDTVPRPDREAVARRVAAWLDPWEEWILAPTYRTARAERAARVPSVLRGELSRDDALRKLWSVVRAEVSSRAKSVEIVQELMNHLTHARDAELSAVHDAVLKAWPGPLGKRVVGRGDQWLDVTPGCPPGDLSESVIVQARRSVIVTLEARFGRVSDRIRRRIEGMEEQAALRQLLRAAATSGSIDTFADALEGTASGV